MTSSKARKAGGRGRRATRPPDHQALGRMESALLAELGGAGVTEAQFVVAAEEPFTFRIWLVTDTDGERDALAADSGLQERVQSAAAAAGLRPLLDGLGVESQETVDRDYGGRWFVRLQS